MAAQRERDADGSGDSRDTVRRAQWTAPRAGILLATLWSILRPAVGLSHSEPITCSQRPDSKRLSRHNSRH